MSKNYIGIDNGVTGSISIITNSNKVHFFKTPIKTTTNYQKTKNSQINRLEVNEFRKILSIVSKEEINNSFVLLERPMINSLRFNASISASRCLEATLIILEEFGFAYNYFDSKSWQTELLPSGIKESKQLKKASLDIGIRLFPSIDNLKHGDFDSLLLAEYGRRNNL